MKTKFKILSFLFIVFLNSILLSQVVFDGKTYTTRQSFSGSSYDKMIIRNCTFKNISKGAIRIDGIKNGLIENCVFEDIGNDASCIYIVNSSPGWTIQNCQFRRIGKNGVLTDEGAVNLIVEKCTFTHIAKRITGARQHGMYIQAPGFLIQDNRIDSVVYANGISVRSTGTIRRNLISRVGLSGNTGDKPGAASIKYYSDHPAGKDTLIIENNICWDSATHGIDLDTGGSTNFENAIIRFNTIIKRAVSYQTNSSNRCIDIDDALANKYVEVYGNLSVNTVNTSDQSAAPENADLSVDNLLFTSDPGFFRDWATNDFRIIRDPRIVDAAPNVPVVPKDDIDGDMRPDNIADIGADEWYLSTSINNHRLLPTAFSLSQNFPNPFNPMTSIRYNMRDAGYVRLGVYNIGGQEVAVLVNGLQPTGKHTVHWQPRGLNQINLTSGLYFARLQSGEQSQTIEMIFLQ